MKLGYSDKLFYYTSSYTNTFIIRYEFIFGDLALEQLREAANEALEFFPEFRKRPVIVKNKLEMEHNDLPVAFIKEKADSVMVGSDETNGYMFFFGYEENLVSFSYFHGVSDIAGMIPYIRTVFYLYAKKTGFEFTKEEEEEVLSIVRLQVKEAEKEKCEEELDPYLCFGDAKAVPKHSYEHQGAFEIPTNVYPADAEYTHIVEIRFSLPEFLEKTHEFGVSVVPLLNDIISSAVRKEFHAGEKPLITMVPVNLRPLFGTDTPANFSDGILIPFEEADEKISVSERCHKWKQFMKAQIEPEWFKRIMGDKVNLIKSFENDPTNIQDLAKAKSALPPKGGYKPISMGLTYPGKLSLSGGLDRMVTDLRMRPWARGNAVIGTTFRDSMRLLVECRTDELTLPEAICHGLIAYGFTPKMEDLGRVTHDIVEMESFKKIE